MRQEISPFCTSSSVINCAASLNLYPSSVRTGWGSLHNPNHKQQVSTGKINTFQRQLVSLSIYLFIAFSFFLFFLNQNEGRPGVVQNYDITSTRRNSSRFKRNKPCCNCAAAAEKINDLRCYARSSLFPIRWHPLAHPPPVCCINVAVSRQLFIKIISHNTPSFRATANRSERGGHDVRLFFLPLHFANSV